MRVVSTPAARDDILGHFRYYAFDQQVPATGARFLDAIEAATDRISQNTSIGAPQRSAAPALAGLRAWPIPGFEEIRLYYLLTPGALTIVRVLHDKRDVRRILEHEPPAS